MKHGPYHNCAMCLFGRTVGLIKTPKDEKGHLCTCGSGKNYEDCHGKQAQPSSETMAAAPTPTPEVSEQTKEGDSQQM